MRLPVPRSIKQGSVVIADLNNDGKLDFAIGGGLGIAVAGFVQFAIVILARDASALVWLARPGNNPKEQVLKSRLAEMLRS